MQITSRSPEETLKLGREIAKKLKAGDILCLFGELGSGKTVLAKGIAAGLGITVQEVISPSFVLMRRHLRGRLPFFHFDLYRLKSLQDILALGYEEFFYGEGVAVIEWADRLKSLLPEESLKIKLSLANDSRRQIKFTACGARYKELLKEIHEDLSC